MKKLLLELAAALGGENVDCEDDIVQFNVGEVEFEAYVKDGAKRLRIKAMLGVDQEAVVMGWAIRQPQPCTGMLQVTEHEDGSVQPRLVFERPVERGEWHLDELKVEVEAYREAWHQDKDLPEDRRDAPREAFGDPALQAPESAWLLMGDEASFPDSEELEWLNGAARAGIHDYLWTAAKQTAAGDLVLIYFVASRSAACFVARAASPAFFSRDITVNALTAVEVAQSWVFLADLVEIEPVPFAQLKKAMNDQLVLRGRSGHFLAPDVVRALDVRPRREADKERLDQLWQVPTGLAELEAPESMTGAQWRRLAPGALRLEADVSSHVVRPLFRFLTLGGDFHIVPEHRVGRGAVDFALMNAGQVVGAIEVKLAIPEPPSGRWSDSKEVRQLRRYTDGLQVPGALIDAHRILLFEPGQDEPCRDIARKACRSDEVDAIRRHFTDRSPG